MALRTASFAGVSFATGLSVLAPEGTAIENGATANWAASAHTAQVRSHGAPVLAVARLVNLSNLLMNVRLPAADARRTAKIQCEWRRCYKRRVCLSGALGANGLYEMVSRY